MILKINNKILSNFSSYSVDLQYNSIASTFTLDVKEGSFSEVLKYSSCILEDETLGPLITGTILQTVQLQKSQPSFIKITGYSQTGVLEDCTLPAEIYPIQFDRLSLTQITMKILDYFCLPLILRGIDVEADANEGPATKKAIVGGREQEFIIYDEEAIKKSVPGNDETVKDYLTRLASERGILLTHNQYGGLVYERLSDVVARKPVAKFKPSTFGILRMDLNIDAQKLHSEITVMVEPSEDNPDSGQYTIQNPYLPPGVRRPTVKILESTFAVDLEKAARFELSKELSAIKVTIVGTKFVRPGELILIHNPEFNLINPSPFMVEKTNIKGGANKIDIYTLTCVPADVYATRFPVSPFS